VSLRDERAEPDFNTEVTTLEIKAEELLHMHEEHPHPPTGFCIEAEKRQPHCSAALESIASYLRGPASIPPRSRRVSEPSKQRHGCFIAM
jgi:hypothetical protein